MRTLSDIIDRVVHEEGGVSNHPDDTGGLTKFGQTIPWLTELYGRPVPPAEVRALTREQAKANYLRWAHKTRIADLAPISIRVCEVVFDFAVNSGHVNVIRAMQRAVDSRPDGVIGSHTLERLAASSEADVVAEVTASRLELFARLVRGAHPFASGWLLRVSRQLRTLW
jgi:lysozyme family protein